MTTDAAPGTGTVSATLIPPETHALVGTRLSDPVTAQITAKDAQRYAQSVGDLNPIYFVEAAAQAAGYRTLTVPPTFVQYAMVQGRPLSETKTDGLFQGAVALHLLVERTMFGGEEWDFLAPVYVGDTITAETRLADLDQKEGSKGPFVRITRETTYTNADGFVVARTRQIGIAR